MTLRRQLVALALLATAVACFADSALDLSLSAEDLADPLATLSITLDLGGERLFGVRGAVRWDAATGATLTPVDGTAGISGAAQLEGSLAGERWVLVGRLSGNASATTSDGLGPLAGTIGASFLVNGEAVGCSLEPWLSAQGVVDPYLETGLRLRLPVLVGPTIVEPLFGADLRRDSDGLWALELEPGISLSWYPGIPFTLEADGRWIGTRQMVGSWTSAWGGTLSLTGVLGEALSILASGSATVGSDGVTGDVRIEASIGPGAAAGGELLFPVRISLSIDHAESPVIGLGGGVQLRW